MTLHLYAQNPPKTILGIENLAPKLGQDIPRSGKHASDSGEEIPTPEKSASVLGQNIPTSGKHASDSGEEIPTSGKHASVLGQNIPTPELFLPVFRQVFKLKKESLPVDDSDS